MQNKIDIQKKKLELLHLQLAEIEVEREKIEKKLDVLRSSLPVHDASTALPVPVTSSSITVIPPIQQSATKDLGRRFSGTAVSILAALSLFSLDIFHNVQSNVNNTGQPGESAMFSLNTAGALPDELQPDSEPMATSVKHKSVYANKKAATTHQWGPLLVMDKNDGSKHYYGFDPVVKAQQENLLTLGFSLGKADGYKGERTRQSIAEFRALYLPDSGNQLRDNELAVIMESYANLARSDAARLGIDHGVVAAIRLSSVRTGVDFSYLMKLAATESNFKPESKASTSSAIGLYQFTHDTWLNTLKKHGAKYGVVADYAADIRYRSTRSGYLRPVVRDKVLYKHLLALRTNPRVSAIMAAETVRENQQKLAKLFDRKPTDTDLYLTHFLGPDGAIAFLRSLEENPGMHAVELFPSAARSNRDIFQPKSCEPRTVDEVYAHFGEKLKNRNYDDVGADTSLRLATN